MKEKNVKTSKFNPRKKRAKAKTNVQERSWLFEHYLLLLLLLLCTLISQSHHHFHLNETKEQLM